MSQRPTGRLGAGDALLIVDVQPDFCPGGALPVAEGEAVIPELNEWVAAAKRAGSVPIYASRDWHPPRHPSFESEGGEWPPHCVQETLGAAYHPDLRLPADAMRIAKGTRLDRDQLSAFDETGLAAHLRARGVRRLFVGGLAQDVCVRATVLDALREGFEVHLVARGTRPVDAHEGEKALREMEAAGAVVAEP
jgi:nicotinamidase/pyrazinamidase